MAWNNYYFKQRKIYANYDLYGIPFTPVRTIDKLEEMIPPETSKEEVLAGVEKFFAGDELWRWVDCLSENVVIPTLSGLKKANGVFFDNPMLSVDFSTKQIVPMEGIAQFKRFPHNKEKLIKISTRTREITTSKDHRFFTIQRNQNLWMRADDFSDLKIKELRAKDLRKKDRLLMVSKLPEPKEEFISPKLAQLLGYILADGNIEYPHRNAIHIDDESEMGLRKYEKIGKELGFSTSLHKHRGVGCYRLRLFGKKEILKLLKTIEDIIKPSSFTTLFIDIPEKIVKSNNRVLSSFLRGFFDGEAHIRVDRSLPQPVSKIEIVNTKRNILEKIKYLLLRFGIDCSKIKEKKDVRKGRKCTWYRILIKDSLSLKLFKKYIGFSHPKKKIKLRFIQTNYKSKRRIFGDIEVGYVTEVKEVEPDTKYLVDFSIPVFENYIANGFIVHNSRSVGKGVKAKAKIVNNILAASRKSFVTIGYSTQIYDQVDKRIRGITDIICYPQLALDNSYCKILTFKGPKAHASGMLQPIYFFSEPIFAVFNTFEKVQPLPDIETKGSEEQEIIIPLTQNLAWVKYLKEMGFSFQKIESYSEEMQQTLLRPEDKGRAPPCELPQEVIKLFERLEKKKSLKKKVSK